MSSRQINFFVMPDEWEPLENYLKENNMISVARRMNTSELQFQKITDNEVYKYILKASDKKTIKAKCLDTDNYFINIENPVIELIKPRFKPETNSLKSGRLYYTTEYWDENEIKNTKNELFIKEAENLFKWFKKNYKTKIVSEFTGFLISKNVKENIEKHQLLLQS